MTNNYPPVPPNVPGHRGLPPPRPEDYRVPAAPGYSHYNSADRVASAPEMGGEAAILAEFDMASREEQFTTALQKIIRYRGNLVPALLDRLENGDIPLAKKAAIALGYLRSPQAISPLIAAVQDQRRQIFWQAASALSWIGSAEAINALIRLLRHTSVNVQAAAAKSLGRASLPAVSPLVDALKNSDDLVKVHAAHSLGQINSPLAVSSLIEALQSQSRSVRFEAAWALGQIRSPLAATALANALTDGDMSVQSQAVQSLKNIGVPALPAIARMLDAHSSHTRSMAARTLGQMGMEEVIPLLSKVLYEDEFSYVRSDAATALGEIGSYEAVFYLAQGLKDPDRAVRNAAWRALHNVNSPEARAVIQAEKQISVIPQYAVHDPKGTVDDDDFTVVQLDE
ncbi:MAG: HEAT repeat domain-containing protein [Pseudanabaenaceae cyanobacterium]|jgi:HEAT repeat protein